MSSPRVLVVDDEADLRELLELTLTKMGLDVACAATLDEARQALERQEFNLVLTDMRLPDGQGIELVREASQGARHVPIAVITAFGSADNAVAALKAGAFDYLVKPLRLDVLRQMVRSALQLQRNETKGKSEREGHACVRLIGESAAMTELRTQIARLARSMAPVAISGESGSGKEVVARDIHAMSARSDKPFVAVNCGAIPEALMEAEFFGYRRGAFTGAVDDRDGFFQAANGGTLMLDEVAELPLPMQVKLLRAIQERRVRKVGATTEEPVDVRLISATHQDLSEWVEQGRFRQDLFYRLNVIELQVPPLRERLADVAALADAILERFCAVSQRVRLSSEAQQALQAYSFPGNVRELENIIERAIAFASDGIIEPADLKLKESARITVSETAALEHACTRSETNIALPGSAAQLEVASASAGTTAVARTDFHDPEAAAVEVALPPCLPTYLEEIERDIILRALARTRFNRTQAAELLGISFRQLRYRMQRLSIHDPDRI